MAVSDRAKELLGQLTLEEKVNICGAADWWRTTAIKRDGKLIVPHIKTTDGPNGARGESFVSGIKAACFPCAENIAASFNTQIAYNSGRGVALEARTKASDVLLAPTICPVRHPLGGRNHETYGEDPLVLGLMGAAYVNGCQSTGVAATPKHYVANEVETRRRFLSAEVDERALREIYLRPFQYVMQGSDPWCWMTSYNRVNGTYASEDKRLIQTILRDEWGFKGLVMSDWVGTYSTVEAMDAGLDLEIPAPLFRRGPLLLKAIQEGKVSEETLDKRAGALIELILKTRRMEHPDDIEEYYDDNKERDEMIAAAAAEGIVLLKNEGKVLPLPKGAKIAVIGQHAAQPPIMGGGSAMVSTQHVVAPIDGLRAAGVDVTFHPGVPVYDAMPLPKPSFVSLTGGSKTQEAKPVRLEWFNGHVPGENKVKDELLATPTFMIKEKWPTWLDRDYCTRLTFDLTPETTGLHNFSIMTTGTSKLYVDGKEIYTRPQEPSLQREAFYFLRSKLEHLVKHEMTAGQTYTVTLESWACPDEILFATNHGEVVQGHALGFMEHIDIAQRISSAADLAASSDIALVFTGTTLEIESEGFDRPHMDLQPNEYALVDAVAAANPKKTVVVNTSGSPVTLTQFADKIAGLVQMFYPGQESGTSLARVLTGAVNPSGRLPVTWPRRVEDNPAFENFTPVDDIVKYEEGIYIGYRHYEKRGITPHFAFGSGLSYTTFALSGLQVTGAVAGKEGKVDVRCRVRNTGEIAGKTVVQFYVRRVSESAFDRPVKELRAFEKPSLEAGAETEVVVALDKNAVSIYDKDCWRAEAGTYEVLAGFASDDIVATAQFEVPETLTWIGL